MGRQPVLAEEGRLGEAHRPVEGALRGRGGRRSSGCRQARARGGAHARGEAGELAPVEANVDGEADVCPAAVGKGREVGSKPAGRRSASGRVSSRRLLRAGGPRPLCDIRPLSKGS
jgi:hypothetical protein